jgi:hypothetical protein
MRAEDLISQVKRMAPRLAGQRVAFVGDHDGTSLLLGILGRMKRVSLPRQMLLLDFDQRVLASARRLARLCDFDHIFETAAYNVSEPLPDRLANQFDWFYTNPPYGSRNVGESARLFIARGCRATKADGGRGCIILPDDEKRPWSVAAMQQTQRFLVSGGWALEDKKDALHRYHLPEDPRLSSSSLLVKRIRLPVQAASVQGNGRRITTTRQMRYVGRRANLSKIRHFYGQSVQPPYPRYIRADGRKEYSWNCSPG